MSEIKFFSKKILSTHFFEKMEGFGSVPALVTNGSGCGAGRPKKNTDPTDLDADSEQWYLMCSTVLKYGTVPYQRTVPVKSAFAN